MRFLALAICVSGLAWAQSPTDVFTKAPPEVEKGLRQRVEEFFKLYAAGKFRAAEALVHNDSKDFFYNAAKSPLISWETSEVKFSDKFTKAVVVTLVELDWYTARAGKIRVKPPMKTLWKLDQGEWWWYVEDQKSWDTPFGRMRPGAEPAKPVAAARVNSIADVINQIQIGNEKIRMPGYKPSQATGTITNNMPGAVEIKLDDAPLPTGLKVTLSKTKLARGETATITFQYDPPDRSPKPETEVNVILLQTGHHYVFYLNFEPDPEAVKRFEGR